MDSPLGAIYALIIFATAAAKDNFGGQALYGIALVSGFVDVDAITLSTAQLAAAQRADVTTAWQAILIASLVDLVFKMVVALILAGFGAVVLALRRRDRRRRDHPCNMAVSTIEVLSGRSFTCLASDNK